jgi:Gas vesicle protein G
MGLIGGLLTLPLAPVRGTAWIAEKVQEVAEAEMYDESSIQAGLRELEAARESGELGEEEIVAAEDVLIERLMAMRGFVEEREYGALE